MKQVICLLSAMLFTALVQAQHILKTIVKDTDTQQLLSGVTIHISGTSITGISNEQGYAELKDIPFGEYAISYSLVGYKGFTTTFNFSSAHADTLLIKLESLSELMDEIVISSTRSSRTIENIPTRVEFIAGEELEEKANMKPGDIRMVLSESTGIQTQQTSATSGNASIRIQGLDGRYTQLLKDGFPLYSGAAAGLGLLQTAPLDLRQIEVIKGSASTLYGGGAIAGLVNLISKKPGPVPEFNLHLNATSAKGLDLNAFYSQQIHKIGFTIFASRNSNAAYDPAKIDLSAIPKFERYTFNPKLFYQFNGKTNASFGINSNFENRIGGDIHIINNDQLSNHTYFERNQSKRLSSQLSIEHRVNEQSKLSFKNSINYFYRILSIPDYGFDGTQTGSFSELNYAVNATNYEWITGINVWTDNFKENGNIASLSKSYNQTTIGAFVQNTAHVNSWFNVELGLRGDYVIDYGFILLPRLSTLFKINNKLSSRVGGGFGYKTPTIFTEESERIQYRNVLPVSADQNKLEKSYGLNADLNYRTIFFNDRFSFSVNQLFFYTYLNNPLSMIAQNDLFALKNLQGHIDTKGTETNIKIGYQDFKLFVGYTYTNTKLHQGSTLKPNPLTSKHRLNNVLMYELNDKWKIGAEAYYFSKQLLTNGNTGKPYWISGFMAEKLWEKFSVYINFENFLDTRQTRFESIYTGPLSNPVFKDIYAPLDGFVVNGGIKLKL